MTRIPLPEPMNAALPVMRRLAEGGFEAVFVGGCVRDTLLDRKITDVDIATSATPEQVMKLFERSVPTGLQHGTVTVIVNEMTYEVTTYRTESAYENHRSPESVAFITDLKGDLLRRDLTINAMGIRMDGELVDPFGGLNDLRRGIIRCVGDPDARYHEDALRMLRTIRFLAEFGFTPAYRTWRALKKHRGLLAYIAMERVRMELDKMIGGADPDRALSLLSRSGLLSFTKERLAAWKEPEPSALCAPVSAGWKRDGLAEPLPLEAKWALLFTRLEAGTGAAAQTMEALRFSGERKSVVGSLLELGAGMAEAGRQAGSDEQALRISWTDSVLRHGKETSRLWLRMLEAAEWLPASESRSLLASWLSAMPVLAVRDLDVSGRELADRLARRPGPWTGKLLSLLLREAALGRIENKKDALLERGVLWNIEEREHE